MKITVPQLLTLNIGEQDAKNITIDFLCEKFDWDVDFRIVDNQVMKIFPQKNMRGVTMSLRPEYIRDASEQDKILDNLFEILLDD